MARFGRRHGSTMICEWHRGIRDNHNAFRGGFRLWEGPNSQKSSNTATFVGKKGSEERYPADHRALKHTAGAFMRSISAGQAFGLLFDQL